MRGTLYCMHVYWYIIENVFMSIFGRIFIGVGCIYNFQNVRLSGCECS